jgi:hypothetical protein
LPFFLSEKPKLESKEVKELIKKLEQKSGDEGDSGTIIGNGGDIASCKDGLYFTDYFLSKSSHQTGGISYYNYKDSHINFVINELYLLDKSMGQSLLSFKTSFMKQLRSKAFTKPAVLHDELPGLFGMLFSINCEVLQAVRRVQSGSRIIYQLDTNLINQLDDANLSWLIVHEWLWNFFNNSKDIFVMNENLQFMGLGLLDSMTKKNILNYLYSQL